jgi:hypothetical protein
VADLFPARFRQYAPEKPRAAKPTVESVRFGSGWCTAECMYAIGDDCDCACMGRNHRAGLRCDAPRQEALL